MNNGMVEAFQEGIAELQLAQVNQQRRSTLLGWTRVIVFLVSLFFLYRALYLQEALYFLWSFTAFAGYSFLFSLHQKIKYGIALLLAKASIWQEEIDRMQFKFDSDRSGEEFINEQHAFSYDLDLFGNGSLFQQINRLEIPGAAKRLAETLTSPMPYKEALDRQKTIRSLSSQVKWRVDWQATLHVNRPKKKVDFNDIDFPKQINPLVTWASITLTLCTVLICIGSVVLNYSFSIILGILPVNIVLLYYNHRSLLRSDQKISRLSTQVKQYMEGFILIKSMHDDTKELKSIKKLIVSETAPAWKNLAQIIYYLDSRDNFMYWILNPFFFLDTWLVLWLYKWGKRYGNDWKSWISEIEWMDCIVSLAGYSNLHGDHVYPILLQEKGVFNAVNLAHPLINPAVRVSNSFQFGTENVILLTGSNMSGKSTFLRTVAINHIMAWVGLPVAATKLETGQAEVFTSMRTTDNLNENTSSFYAELKRIKQLLTKIQYNRETVFFYFLDEILKGTNSHDRHKGAMGLIKQLLTTNAKGFVSTHDLDLAYHYKDESMLKNYSFNSKLVDGQLLFDYQLTDTICHSTNASDLMSQMGIIRVADKE